MDINGRICLLHKMKVLIICESCDRFYCFKCILDPNTELCSHSKEKQEFIKVYEIYNSKYILEQFQTIELNIESQNDNINPISQTNFKFLQPTYNIPQLKKKLEGFHNFILLQSKKRRQEGFFRDSNYRNKGREFAFIRKQENYSLFYCVMKSKSHFLINLISITKIKIPHAIEYNFSQKATEIHQNKFFIFGMPHSNFNLSSWKINLYFNANI